MDIIENKSFDEERALYGIENKKIINCRFDGEADGESALKEAKNFTLFDCYMNLRYPLWHSERFTLEKIKMTEGCRAAIWYSKDIVIKDSTLNGIKALRECENINIANTNILSPEFGWKSKNISLACSNLESEYAFLESKNLKINNLSFKGKYSFQYTKDLEIINSNLDTKDAFWHAENVIVKDSVVKGEYLGWYSKGLTFINCKIIGTQPLCYAKNLKLINCEMIDCDLAFEYSEVEAQINGSILSLKNPIKGHIAANKIGEIILKDSKYPLECKIEEIK